MSVGPYHIVLYCGATVRREAWPYGASYYIRLSDADEAYEKKSSSTDVKD